MWAVPCRALTLGNQRCHCSAPGETLAVELEIEVAEVVYGVAVGVEEGGVEIADGGVDVLLAQVEVGVDVFEVVHADGDAVAEAGDQAGGGEFEMGLEAVHAVFGTELLGEFGGAVADDVAHRGEFFASLLEFFEGDEVVVEFGVFCPCQRCCENR